jgi:hypothetical protein
MSIDKSLYEAPDAKKNKKILLASESGEEEADTELDQLIKQFEEWQKENSGGWKDFLKSSSDPKIIRLNSGGRVRENSYAQLIDDYENNIQVIEIDGVRESLTNYIKRMGGVDHSLPAK